MIRSMTGYGEASGPTAAGTLRVELRTVNHRYLNLNTRLPSSLARWENEIKDWLRPAFSRGHVNCTARWEPASEAAGERRYRLDEDRVANYLRLFEVLASKFGVSGSPDLALLTRFNDVIVRAEEEEASHEVQGEELREILVEAAKQVTQMRIDEGQRLETDLRERVGAIEQSLSAIEALAPTRLENERIRLSEAVQELLEGAPVDQTRVAQEIAFLAERWDVNEELVRFRSHNELLLDLLDSDSEEPVGKRLSFLVQEMHREANTIGSKANDAGISHLVVAIKDELERLREQVENVE
ncbi:MAG: YicC/YloC family endoribonuclease [Gemmatimonadota bacterium]